MTRSPLFSSTEFADPEGRFWDAARSFSELPSAAMRSIIDSVPVVAAATTPYRRRHAVNQSIEDSGVDRRTAGMAVDRFLYPLYSAWTDLKLSDDAPSDNIVADLVEIGSVAAENRDRLAAELSYFFADTIPKLIAVERAQATTAGVLPVLLDVDATVELRAVVSIRQVFGEPSEAYTPTVDGVVPMVSLAFQSDAPDEPAFVCQVDSTALDAVIDRLQGARKELAALVAFAAATRATSSDGADAHRDGREASVRDSGAT